MKQPPTLQEIKEFADHLFEVQNAAPVADLENGPHEDDCDCRPVPYRECWRAASSTLRGAYTGKEFEWQNHFKW